jgi:hypothetical protein
MQLRSPDVDLDNRISVAWLILADHADVVGDKLYLLGGGWDRIIVQGQLGQYQLSFAIAFRVPWSETNSRHHAEIEIQDADAHVLGQVGVDFEVGRPAGITQGQSQLFQMAINHLPINFEKSGVYTIVPRIDGDDDPQGRTTFTVIRRS